MFFNMAPMSMIHWILLLVVQSANNIRGQFPANYTDQYSCPQMYNSLSGTLRHPNFPYNYKTPVQCSMSIYLNNDGPSPKYQVVHLTARMFETSGDSVFAHDWLEVSYGLGSFQFRGDGTKATDGSVKENTKAMRVGETYTCYAGQSNYFHLEFHSGNGFTNIGGFIIDYEVETVSADYYKCPKQFTAPLGYIQSFEYPNNYLTNMKCEYTIQLWDSPNDNRLKRVTLKAEYFSTGNSGEVENSDWLLIEGTQYYGYDERNEHAMTINQTLTFYKMAEYFVLEWVTGSSNARSGFSIHYTVSDVETEPGPGGVDNQGKLFAVGFLYQYDGVERAYPKHQLAITSWNGANVEVYSNCERIMRQFTITPGEVTRIEFDRCVEATYGVQLNGISVKSDMEIIVQGINANLQSSDAFLGIPLIPGPNVYIIPTYFTAIFDYNQLTVVASAATTTQVTFIPRRKTGIYWRDAKIVDLKYMETFSYYLYGTRNDQYDLTGTIIYSNKTISVFSGNRCTKVEPTPSFRNNCSHTAEQIPPVSTWGREFYVVPVIPVRDHMLIRIIAALPNTTASINGGDEIHIADTGEFIERKLDVSSVHHILCSEPCLVVHYNIGGTYAAARAHAAPYMTMIPSVEQYTSNIHISTFTRIYNKPFTDYISVIAPTEKISQLYIDGEVIPTSNWTVVNSKMATISLQVDPGEHVVHHNDPTVKFMVFVYGNAQIGTDSYGYPGGIGTHTLNDGCKADSCAETQAVCIPGVNSTFHCFCKEGWTGLSCQKVESTTPAPTDPLDAFKCPQLHTNASGIIYNPGYPNGWPYTYQCTIKIDLHSNVCDLNYKQITLSVEKFQLKRYSGSSFVMIDDRKYFGNGSDPTDVNSLQEGQTYTYQSRSPYFHIFFKGSSKTEDSTYGFAFHYNISTIPGQDKPAINQARPGNKGQCFAMTFTPACGTYHDRHMSYIIVMSQKPTNVSIYVALSSYDEFRKPESTRFVTPTDPWLYKADFSLTEYTEGGIHMLSAIVKADEDLTVYGQKANEYRADGYLALPVGGVDSYEYMIGSYTNKVPRLNNRKAASSGFAVVATEDNTVLNISLKANQGYNSTILTVIIDKLQVYWHRNTVHDVTGTVVKSNKAISLFSGHSCCPGLALEQLPPMSTWGTEFVVQPIYKSKMRYNWREHTTLRVIASEDNTSVGVKNDGLQAYINKGEYYEVRISNITYMYIVCSKPCLVLQYWPTMVIIPPLSSYISNTYFHKGLYYKYNYANPSTITTMTSNYLHFASPTQHKDGFLIDNSPMPANWTKILGTEWSVAVVRVIENSSIYINHTDPSVRYSVLYYGFGSYYPAVALPLGLNFDKIQDVCLPNPCLNDGLCMKRVNGGTSCLCINGYYGDTCALCCESTIPPTPPPAVYPNLCPQMHTSQSGYIQSPMYPLNYPNKQDCRIQIDMTPFLSSDFQEIVLYVEDFHLEKVNYAKHALDYLTIEGGDQFTGSTDRAMVVGKYYIYRNSKKKQYFNLNFVSNEYRMERGFSLKYTTRGINFTSEITHSHRGRKFAVAFPRMKQEPTKYDFYKDKNYIIFTCGSSTDILITHQGQTEQIACPGVYSNNVWRTYPKSSRADIGVENKGYIIEASEEIAVYVYSIEKNGYYSLDTSEAYLALPMHKHMTEFIVMSYMLSTRFTSYSSILVIASEDSTTVTITKRTERRYNFFKEITIKLNKGETYQHLDSTDDLTGSIVKSNKPISVVSGSTCSTIPTTSYYQKCDYLVEQMPPVFSLGKEFITPSVNRPLADDVYLRVLAYYDDTTIEVPALQLSQSMHLMMGEYWDVKLPKIDKDGFYANENEYYIKCSYPCLVAIFTPIYGSSQFPSMFIIPPMTQFVTGKNYIPVISMIWNEYESNVDTETFMQAPSKYGTRLYFNTGELSESDWNKIPYKETYSGIYKSSTSKRTLGFELSHPYIDVGYMSYTYSYDSLGHFGYPSVMGLSITNDIYQCPQTIQNLNPYNKPTGYIRNPGYPESYGVDLECPMSFDLSSGTRKHPPWTITRKDMVFHVELFDVPECCDYLEIDGVRYTSDGENSFEVGETYTFPNFDKINDKVKFVSGRNSSNLTRQFSIYYELIEPDTESPLVKGHIGKYFLLGFLKQLDRQLYLNHLEIHILTAKATTITISYTHPSNSSNITNTYHVAENEQLTLNLPKELTMLGGIEQKVISVKSSEFVSVFTSSFTQVSTDGYLALPVSTVGEHYILAAYGTGGIFDPRQDLNGNSTFGIIATEDGTIVEIIECHNGVYHTNSYTVSIDKFESYSAIADDDITGTIIRSNKPVAVLSGNDCANVPNTRRLCSHLVEMLPPVNSWGDDFYAISSKPRNAGDILRIIARGNTKVELSPGGLSKDITLGEYWEVVLDHDVFYHVTCAMSCLVMQYCQSQTADSRSMGPFMTIVPAVSQYSKDYRSPILNSYNGDPYTNYAHVYVQKEYTSQYFTDAFRTPEKSWSTGVDFDYSAARIDLTDAILAHEFYNLNGVTRFGTVLYGSRSSYDTYAFPAGLELEAPSGGCQGWVCLNDGLCVITADVPKCQCVNGYEGPFCETTMTTTTSTTTTTPTTSTTTMTTVAMTTIPKTTKVTDKQEQTTTAITTKITRSPTDRPTKVTISTTPLTSTSIDEIVSGQQSGPSAGVLGASIGIPLLLIALAVIAFILYKRGVFKRSSSRRRQEQGYILDDISKY
ncbi:unnamed protein product [Owenia fusiformis]|uniref:Uncharacterized protein n=1 Tax=Owenia fusiformis TaxID=6347 RepID=A0A8J1U0P7_OWEFU|nr:unnamed protein product [Owenia fusiformis]